MPTARVNDIDIWYERSRGDGPTVILHHGFAGPSSFGWPDIVQRLKPSFDLVLYDARAHGKTTVPAPETVTMPQFAADMAGIMDALEIPRAHIAGVSMGGMVAAQFACDYPDRVLSLALCDTVAANGGSDDPEATAVEHAVVKAFERMIAIVEKHGLQGLVDRENRHRHEQDKYAHLQSTSLEEQDRRNQATKTQHMTAEGFIASAHALASRPDLSSRTPNIKSPTLVSCGEWDLFWPCARRDARLLPNSRFVTIERAAHDTLWFQPEAWYATITAFLQEHSSA
jgi:3-oxoadipate enol-lactonase